jgi:hypothetical protein
MLNKINKYFSQIKKDININIDPIKNYKYKFYTDNNNNHIVQLFDNNKIIIEAIYDIAGMYNIYNNVWYWGWNIDVVDRQLVKQSEKVKEFAKYIKNNSTKMSNNIDMDKLYYWSSNGNFYISHANIIHPIKLVLYLTKSMWYMPVCYGKDSTKPVLCTNKKHISRIEYILIKKIIKIY